MKITIYGWSTRQVLPDGEADKRVPGRRIDRETRAGYVLGVAYVYDVRADGDLDAFAAIARAVNALEPSQFGLNTHVSPSSFSTYASDSLGVRACARRIP